MKMKTSHVLVFLLGLAGSASGAITIAGGNGSFETNTIGTSTYTDAWYLNPQAVSGIHLTQWSNITGWTLTAPGGGAANGATAWLMGGSTYGTASDGNYFVNVEGGPNWWLTTTISGLTIGKDYTVYFDARQRSGAAGNFDVFVNTTVPAGGFNIAPSSTSWAQQSFTFNAEALSHTLTISNVDYSTYAETLTGNGVLVDNFSVVPEPSAALLGGLGLLALLRRKR